MQTAYAIMNAALAPAVSAGPLYAITIVSIFVAVLFAAIYKLLVNRQKSDFIKTELKDAREKMKKARDTRNDKEFKALTGKMLQLQNQQMALSMKPTLVSLVFVAVIFSWLGYMYGDVTVALANSTGQFKYHEYADNITVTVSKQDNSTTVAFASGHAPATVGSTTSLGGTSFQLSYVDDVRSWFQKIGGGDKTQGIKFQNLGSRFKVPYSESTVGWLWIYVLMSLPATFVSRKLLGVD